MTGWPRLASVSQRVDANMPRLVSDLQTLIRQPSVSAKGEGIEECAQLVCAIMEGYGIGSRLLRLRKGVAPIVYGEVASKANPSKTLLFYNHYDVQPAEPLDLWEHPPFSGTRRGNKVFGRGAADDKGELMTRIAAVGACLEASGDVPCNVKFLVEGEEEIGSEHIAAYLQKYRARLACDAVIWEFGYVDARDRPIVSLGMKGLLYVELSVTESVRDAHSSLAVLIKNPAWRLVAALQTLRGEDGRILVRDWYRDVVPLSDADMRLVRGEPFDANSFRKEYGVRSFVGGVSGTAAKEALVAGATCNIAGIASGYGGDGAKTVLPASAVAKIDFRLVPGMDPGVQVRRLRRHLKSKGFADVGVRVFHAEAAARTDSGDPFVSHVRDAATGAFGSCVTSVSSAGTGPMRQFVDILGAPCVSVGSTHVFSRIHSPNEFARTDLLRKTAKCMCGIMENLGRT